MVQYDLLLRLLLSGRILYLILLGLCLHLADCHQDMRLPVRSIQHGCQQPLQRLLHFLILLCLIRQLLVQILIVLGDAALDLLVMQIPLHTLLAKLVQQHLLNLTHHNEALAPGIDHHAVDLGILYCSLQNLADGHGHRIAHILTVLALGLLLLAGIGNGIALAVTGLQDVHGDAELILLLSLLRRYRCRRKEHACARLHFIKNSVEYLLQMVLVVILLLCKHRNGLCDLCIAL